MQIDLLSNEIQLTLKKHDFNINAQENLNICKFLLLLNDWNKVYNLTGHKNSKALIEEHVLDACTALRPLKKKSMKNQSQYQSLLM